MQQPSRLTFAGFEIDLQASVLRKNGEPVRISRQAFRALALLVSRGGELVTRDELKKEIWGDRVHGDFEHGLNVCIGMVRSALSDDTEGSPIIVTCPREGYRLGVPVKSRAKVGWSWPSLRGWAAIWAIVAAGSLLVYSISGERATPAGTASASADSRAVGSTTAPSMPLSTAAFSRPWPGRNVEASEWYWRGRAFYDRSTGRKPFGALPYFQKAAALDSNFTLAHAALALAYMDRAAAGIEPGDSTRLARIEAQRALALDPGTAETHVAVAEISYRLNGDTLNADKEFVQALKLDGRNAYVHQRYATYLQAQRRLDDALRQIGIAVEQAPLSVVSSWQKAYTLLLSKQWDAALKEATRTLELDPTHPQSFRTIGQCLEAMGRRDDAIEAYLKGGRAAFGQLGRLYGLMGRRAEAHAILASLNRPSDSAAAHNGVAIAYIYTGLGETAAAVNWLEKAHDVGRALPPSLRVTPQWDPLRGSDAFDKFLKNNRVGGI